jgi:tetratricopeptide (TPR) repeat protein
MPRSATTQRESTGRAAVIRPPEFVGRERELAALTQALAGEPTVVLVEGEAGIGKTRLIKEFLASPAGQHLSALVATCPPFRQPHTLGPIADAVRQAATGRIRDLKLSALAGALRPLFPDWATDLPPAPEPVDDPTTARHRVLTGLAELLAALDVGVLIVEDLHWADETTVEFLLSLVSRQPQRVSLLVTCRPEDVLPGSLLPRLSRHAAGNTGLRLILLPLTTNQTASLVSSMLAGESITAEFAAFLHQRTEGLPLAVEECVRLMGDRADLAFRYGQWARRHLSDIEVPATVRDAVLERVGRLGPEAVAALRAAAVLGEPTAVAVVQLVAGLAGDRATAGLYEALGCGLLIENFPNRQELMFRHALAAQAVYEAIPGPLRREMHRRAGKALEEAPAPSPARLARHFREAGDEAAWSGHAEEAADLALAAGDHNAAAALLHDVVANADLKAGAIARLVCKIPIMALPGYAPVKDLTRSLRSILASDAALTRAQRAEAGWQLGRILMDAGEYQAGAAELERAIPGLGHRPAEAAQAMTWLGLPCQSLWPVAVHQRWLDWAAATASDPAVPTWDRLKLLADRATALLLMGEEAGWTVAAELPGDAPTPREALALAVGLTNVADGCVVWGQYETARKLLAIALRLAERYHYPRVHDTASVTRVHLDFYTGSWAGLADRSADLIESTDIEPLLRMEAVLTAALLNIATGPPRVFRTAELTLFHAASCRFRYSSWTSCGVL